MAAGRLPGSLPVVVESWRRDKTTTGIMEIGRAAEDLVQSRWVLGDRVFPRGPAPGALEHCRGPVRSAGVPLGALGPYRDVWIGGFDG